MQAQKIVTIGGGTGTFTLLSGLKKYPEDVLDITAVVTMADSGGSTGRLRDEFGYLPVGDVRMALAALSDTNGSELLRKLFLYRFDKGTGLSGHNFGNLFLVALTDILGSEERAIEYAGEILRVRGKVLPVTAQKTDLVATYSDGTTVIGESEIDEPHWPVENEKKIERVTLSPDVPVTKKVQHAIARADCIVLGPGDLYTSIIPNLLAGGMQDAIQSSPAKLVYVLNLMTKFGQTTDYSAHDHLSHVSEYAGRKPDHIVVNREQLPADILEKYRDEHEYPVRDDLSEVSGIHVYKEDLLAEEEVKKTSGDTLKRSLIRHDPDKLANAIISILETYV